MITFYDQTFWEKKQVILTDVSFCEKNQFCSTGFLEKFHELANDLHEIKMNHHGDEKLTVFKE